LLKLCCCFLFLLILPPAVPTPRLVVMGDSITVGRGASTPDRSWAAIVARDLGMPLTNVAISGSRVAEQPIPAVTRGDTVIWLVGYNDMRAGTPITEFRATVAQGVTQMQQRGAQVVLVSGLRMSPAGYAAYAPQWNHGSDAQVARYAESVRDLAPFVDLQGIPPSTTNDLVHPDNAGHAAIAAAILAPTLTTQWQPDGLHVTWSAPESACLYAVDGAAWTYLSDTPCAASGEAIMPLAGDVGYTARMGRRIVLLSTSGEVLAETAVPARYTLAMPILLNGG